ncbi:hypothetical protein VTI28DRAFT_4146 [Corynascus sepedonium]
MSHLVPTPESPVSAPPDQQSDSTPTTPASLGSSLPKPYIHQPPGYATSGRRTHKKSRTGCLTCKSRKIKCDERHPACLNCISHGVQCPFLKAGDAAGTFARPSKAMSRSSVLSAKTPTPRPDMATTLPEGGSLPLLELELLHNFTTKTYTTLTADSCLWDFWRDDVVQLGLSEDYIMRAVLAVSALHLAYHRPDRRDFYVEEGIILHQKASRAAMRVMASDGIDKDRAASLFIFSMLTIFFALASPRRSNPDGTFFIGESGFPDWAFLLSGSKSIMEVLGQQAGLDTVAGPFLRYGQRRWHAQRALLAKINASNNSNSNSNSNSNNNNNNNNGNDGDNNNEDEHRPEQPPPTSQPLLAPLRARIHAAVSDPDLLRTYVHALDELELALVGVRADPAAPRDVLDAMVWLWVVSDELLPLLRGAAAHERKTTVHQEAVAVFAHFGLLLRHHESHWWLQGWGDHVVRRASEILDEEHRTWIEWPLREMAQMRWHGAVDRGRQLPSS